MKYVTTSTINRVNKMKFLNAFFDVLIQLEKEGGPKVRPIKFIDDFIYKLDEGAESTPMSISNLGSDFYHKFLLDVFNWHEQEIRDRMCHNSSAQNIINDPARYTLNEQILGSTDDVREHIKRLENSIYEKNKLQVKLEARITEQHVELREMGVNIAIQHNNNLQLEADNRVLRDQASKIVQENRTKVLSMLSILKTFKAPEVVMNKYRAHFSIGLAEEVLCKKENPEPENNKNLANGGLNRTESEVLKFTSLGNFFDMLKGGIPCNCDECVAARTKDRVKETKGNDERMEGVDVEIQNLLDIMKNVNNRVDALRLKFKN